MPMSEEMASPKIEFNIVVLLNVHAVICLLNICAYVDLCQFHICSEKILLVVGSG